MSGSDSTFKVGFTGKIPTEGCHRIVRGCSSRNWQIVVTDVNETQQQIALACEIFEVPYWIIAWDRPKIVYYTGRIIRLLDATALAYPPKGKEIELILEAFTQRVFRI